MQGDIKASHYVDLAYRNIRFSGMVKREFESLPKSDTKKIKTVGPAVLYGDRVPRYRDPRLFQSFMDGFTAPIPYAPRGGEQSLSRPHTTPEQSRRVERVTKKNTRRPSLGLGSLADLTGSLGLHSVSQRSPRLSQSSLHFLDNINKRAEPTTPPSATELFGTGRRVSITDALTKHNAKSLRSRALQSGSSVWDWDNVPWNSQVDNWRAGEEIEFPPPGWKSCNCQLVARFHNPAPLPPQKPFFA